jgi:hypothetical protein
VGCCELGDLPSGPCVYNLYVDYIFFILQDGFVLVGSVGGQRYWSSMLTLDSTITCGIWTPDDQQVSAVC